MTRRHRGGDFGSGVLFGETMMALTLLVGAWGFISGRVFKKFVVLRLPD